MFFALYWTMTGIHGFHVFIGMILIAWLIWRGKKGHLHANHYMPASPLLSTTLLHVRQWNS